MNKNEQVSRGRRATTILEDSLVIEAFEKIDEKLMKGFRDSDLDDAETREVMFRMMRAMDLFKKHFEQVVRTGKNAETEILHSEKK